jgi:hypothetical protein
MKKKFMRERKKFLFVKILIKINKYFFNGYLKILKRYFESYFLRNFTFAGWGMTTTTNPPWTYNNNNEIIKFEEIDNKLIQHIKNEKFILTQFGMKEKSKNTKKEIENYLLTLKELKWRHLIVYYSFLLAKKFTHKEMNIVECGVCDGLTIFYAINAYTKKNYDLKVYLYDSWKKMERKHLNDQELHHLGDYNYLNVNITKNNLRDYTENLIFNVGYIPEVLALSNYPKHLSWLHIDLNSSSPTIEALKFFYEKLNSKGVILFDDYGHKSYEPTKYVIDNFFNNLDGQLIALPTGQAMFIKV